MCKTLSLIPTKITEKNFLNIEILGEIYHIHGLVHSILLRCQFFSNWCIVTKKEIKIGRITLPDFITCYKAKQYDSGGSLEN